MGFSRLTHLISRGKLYATKQQHQQWYRVTPFSSKCVFLKTSQFVDLPKVLYAFLRYTRTVNIIGNSV